MSASYEWVGRQLMSGVYWRSRTRTLTIVPEMRLPLRPGSQSVRRQLSERTLIGAVCFLLEQVIAEYPHLRIDHVRIRRCQGKRPRRRVGGQSAGPPWSWFTPRPEQRNGG